MKKRLSTIVFYDPLVIQLNGLKFINAFEKCCVKDCGQGTWWSQVSNVKKFMPPFPYKTHIGSHEYGKSQRSEINFTSEFHGLTKSIIENCKSVTATHTHRRPVTGWVSLLN